MGDYYGINDSRLAKRKREKRRNIIVALYIVFVALSVFSMVEYRAYLRGEAEMLAAEALMAMPAEKVEAVPLPDTLFYEAYAEEDDEDAGDTTEAGMTEEEIDPTAGLPHDKLFITGERRRYQDNDLTLIIPKLDKVLPVYDGVTGDVLKKGVGLYDYAQLPGKGNRNVSLAGHRNTSRLGVITDKAPFYYVDKLVEGDYLYLTDAEYVYRYLYEDTKVVEPDDWGPIYSQGFSCLTITSCTPIGISSHRIVVRGRLDEIFLLTEDFAFAEDDGGVAASYAEIEQPAA